MCVEDLSAEVRDRIHDDSSDVLAAGVDYGEHRPRSGVRHYGGNTWPHERAVGQLSGKLENARSAVRVIDMVSKGEQSAPSGGSAIAVM